MSATTNEVPAPVADEKAEKRKAAAAAKKAAAEVEATIADATAVAVQAKLDAELLTVETAGYTLATDWRESGSPPEVLAAQIAAKAAEERRAYVERFAIDTRGKAAWAARKLSEARTHLEDTKEVMKAEVKRAERDYEGRLEFFEPKLQAWAASQPPDKGTKGSVRLAEAGVRLELRDAEVGGVRILDEKLLADEIVEKLGPMEALELGLVKQIFVIDRANVEEFLEGHDKIAFKNAVVEPKTATKKLVVVRLAK